MAWKETGPLIERHRLIADDRSGAFERSELVERYGVSRKTVYKWIERFAAEGAEGLKDRSRRPESSPEKTDEAIEQQILKYRRTHPHRGPKKIVAVLRRDRPEVEWPAPSTVGDILKRNGLVEPQSPRRTGLHPLVAPPSPPAKSSEQTTADFKGQFLMGNGAYCYALTIVDAHSHFILACEALASTEYAAARRVFQRVFRKHGMPERILSDNGVPFASTGLARLSRLNVWWMRLGVKVERIWPGRPDQNGAHERMHRELKRETTRPPGADLREQQRIFNRFIIEYNTDRPHEALGQTTPQSCFAPSDRPYPERLPPLEYPGHFETRKADNKGTISWRGRRVFLAAPLAGEVVGLEPTDHDLWSIHFASAIIGRFDERSGKVYG